MAVEYLSRFFLSSFWVKCLIEYFFITIAIIPAHEIVSAIPRDIEKTDMIPA